MIPYICITHKNFFDLSRKFCSDLFLSVTVNVLLIFKPDRQNFLFHRKADIQFHVHGIAVDLMVNIKHAFTRIQFIMRLREPHQEQGLIGRIDIFRVPLKMIDEASAALDPHRIFQRAVARDTHADIIEALLPGRHSGIIIGPFQKLRIRPDIVLILPDKTVPVSGKLPVIADPSFIDHIIVRNRFRRDPGIAFLKALHMPFLMMKKGMLHGISAAFPSEISRGHAVMLPERGAVIGGAVPVIRPDLRDPALLLCL